MENITKPPFLQLNRIEQKTTIEAIIFASEEPISIEYLIKILILNEISSTVKKENIENNQAGQTSIGDEIQQNLNISKDYFLEIINELNKELLESNRPYHIIKIGGGWQFATRPEYGELLQRMVKTKAKRRFSQATLETLSIIAYKQPITKAEVEQIRGVNSAEIINTLFEKKLVDIVGRKESLGRPLLYGTTIEFLKIFGINSLSELPKLREFEEIAQQSEYEEQVEIKVEIQDVQALQDISSDIIARLEEESIGIDIDLEKL
jgi:segregation and condensation protein B